MGALTIQIGALTRSSSAPDAKMQAVLTEVIEATGGPTGGTNAQQADHVLLVIRRHLIEVANGNRRHKAIADAQADIDGDLLDLAT